MKISKGPDDIFRKRKDSHGIQSEEIFPLQWRYVSKTYFFNSALQYIFVLQYTEKYVIYNGDKEEYGTCRIMSNNPRIVAYCTEPYIER